MGKISAGRLAAKALKAEGVECVFAITALPLIPLLEGCEAEGIKVIGMRSEQGCATAADGWSHLLSSRRPKMTAP